MGDPQPRRPWAEGPDEQAPPESWLTLDDDALLHRIATCDARENEDDRLLEVVESDRHFFIRQEAAKRVRDRRRLFAFEGDRHVGQILVRHLTRREDVTYLERLSARSHHGEVRSAAQVQLARLWRCLDAPEMPARAPEAPASAPEAPASAPEAPASAPEAPAPAPEAPAPAPESSAEAVPAPVPGLQTTEPVTSAALEKGGVDGSLLGWAAHFVVEQAWSHLGTRATGELLARTRRNLLGRYPSLVFFEVSEDARVAVKLDSGLRLPGAAVTAVAAWMTALRAEALGVAPDIERASVRALTGLVADALRDAGFYAACDELEAGLQR